MKIELENIREHLAFRKWINSLKLEEIEVTDGGVLDEWKFIGMSNISFFEMEFWKVEDEDEATD